MAGPASEGPLTRNPISIAGAWLTTLAAFAFLGYLLAEWLGLLDNPYSGLLGFVGVPAVFALGLALIPLGMWREARRRRRGRAAWQWPAVDLGIRRTRLAVGLLALLTIVNVTLIGVAGFGATHYMEKTEFCGQVCHGPMKPEATAHQAYPHAKVACVSCHVGPGASGMLRAKMNGTRQLYLLATGGYSRPIPVPAHGLPDAAGTCENCHTPGHPDRDLVRTTREYADDEANTETVNETLLYMAKNHWHARADISVEYVATDAIRETIPYVKLTDASGKVTEFFAPKTTAVPAGTARRMDCLDCHTRPAHSFAPSAEIAVDRAIAAGQIPRTLPFVRREAVKALKGSYPSEESAIDAISRSLRDFYKPHHAQSGGDEGAEIDRAVLATQNIHRRSVFPDMKVTFGTYANNIGHIDAPGCFRCHDDEHVAKDGKKIGQDCATCHAIE